MIKGLDGKSEVGVVGNALHIEYNMAAKALREHSATPK